MSDEPTNRHSMKHKRWEREQPLIGFDIAPPTEVEGDVQPGGGDPALKGFDPPEDEGLFAKMKGIFRGKPDRPIPDPNISESSR